MMMVPGSMKNGDLPSVIAGLGVGLLDVLTRSPGGFCSLPLKYMFPNPTYFPYVLHRAWHTGETGQPHFAEGFGISGF